MTDFQRPRSYTDPTLRHHHYGRVEPLDYPPAISPRAWFWGFALTAPLWLALVWWLA